MLLWVFLIAGFCLLQLNKDFYLVSWLAFSEMPGSEHLHACMQVSLSVNVIISCYVNMTLGPVLNCGLQDVEFSRIV